MISVESVENEKVGNYKDENVENDKDQKVKYEEENVEKKKCYAMH